MLIVSSVLDLYSNNGPSIDDVLFNEDISLVVRLEPKMASKSTFEALSSGTTSSPIVRSDLRYIYVTEVQVELSPAVIVFKVLLSKYAVLVRSVNAVHCNNYCSALTFRGFSLSLTSKCTSALKMPTLSVPATVA